MVGVVMVGAVLCPVLFNGGRSRLLLTRFWLLHLIAPGVILLVGSHQTSVASLSFCTASALPSSLLVSTIEKPGADGVPLNCIHTCLYQSIFGGIVAAAPGVSKVIRCVVGCIDEYGGESKQIVFWEVHC